LFGSGEENDEKFMDLFYCLVWDEKINKY